MFARNPNLYADCNYIYASGARAEIWFPLIFIEDNPCRWLVNPLEKLRLYLKRLQHTEKKDIYLDISHITLNECDTAPAFKWFSYFEQEYSDREWRIHSNNAHESRYIYYQTEAAEEPTFYIEDPTPVWSRYGFVPLKLVYLQRALLKSLLRTNHNIHLYCPDPYLAEQLPLDWPNLENLYLHCPITELYTSERWRACLERFTSRPQLILHWKAKNYSTLRYSYSQMIKEANKVPQSHLYIYMRMKDDTSDWKWEGHSYTIIRQNPGKKDLY